MIPWQQFVRLTDAALARADIAAVNWACAFGLPGLEVIDWKHCLWTIDGWAESCRRFTDAMMPHFRAGRCDFPESEPKFRIQAMVTHLQRDLGVRYHPDRIAEGAKFEPADSFIHGVIQGNGGTCGNLPVVYTAVGRRLGYPLMLATTRNHLFCRWDALPGGECFNIEASGKGVSFFTDDHYRTGRFQMPAETIKACGYLESLSPREELAGFLCQRGECWMQEKNYGEAVTAFAWAHEMDPRRGQHAFLTQQATRVWKETLQPRLPKSRYFPKLDIGRPVQQFRRMPVEAERELIGLTVTQKLLDDQNLIRRWWHPLQLDPNRRPADLPDVLRIDFSWNGPDRANPS